MTVQLGEVEKKALYLAAHTTLALWDVAGSSRDDIEAALKSAALCLEMMSDDPLGAASYGEIIFTSAVGLFRGTDLALMKMGRDNDQA